MRKIVCLLIVVLFAGCAASRVELLSDSFKPDTKNIVFLSNDPDLRKLRVSLLKRGFKVPKYAGVSTTVAETKITEEGSVTVTKAFGAMEARYGIELVGTHELDWCGSSKKKNLTIEVVDMGTNEVVAYVTEGGWDGPCIIYKADLYDKLAKRIDMLWKNRYKPIEEEEWDD